MGTDTPPPGSPRKNLGQKGSGCLSPKAEERPAPASPARRPPRGGARPRGAAPLRAGRAPRSAPRRTLPPHREAGSSGPEGGRGASSPTPQKAAGGKNGCGTPAHALHHAPRLSRTHTRDRSLGRGESRGAQRRRLLEPEGKPPALTRRGTHRQPPHEPARSSPASTRDAENCRAAPPSAAPRASRCPDGAGLRGASDAGAVSRQHSICGAPANGNARGAAVRK